LSIFLACKKVCKHVFMLIAVANSKGGVGKTTVSVHYAVAQAERGRKTALIDSDAQGSSTRWLQDVQDSVAVFPLKTADDVIDQAPRIVSQFDVVVADGPAGLSEVTRALLLVADLALLPCGPSALDLRAAQDAIRCPTGPDDPERSAKDLPLAEQASDELPA
jgi:chromosome partitioning protein